MTKAGFGFILIDHYGIVLKSGVGPLFQVTRAEHAELMAIWLSWGHILEYWG